MSRRRSRAVMVPFVRSALGLLLAAAAPIGPDIAGSSCSHTFEARNGGGGFYIYAYNNNDGVRIFQTGSAMLDYRVQSQNLSCKTCDSCYFEIRPIRWVTMNNQFAPGPVILLGTASKCVTVHVNGDTATSTQC